MFGGRTWVWDGRAWRREAEEEDTGGGGTIPTDLDASDIVSGVFGVNRGGTGISFYTTGNYIRASSPTSLEEVTPAQVLLDIQAAPLVHTHQWSSISNTPSTVAGYGITDGITFFVQDTQPPDPAPGVNAKWLDTANWILYVWYSSGTGGQWVEYGPTLFGNENISISDVQGLQSALDNKIDIAAIGASNGVAPLGADAKIPTAYLPSYVDDVIEAANFASLPPTGEQGKIYVTLDDLKTYRWSGTTYVEIGGAPATPPSLLVSKLNASSSVTLTKGTAVSLDPSGNLIKAAADTTSLSFLGFVYDDTIPPSSWGRVIMEGTINNTVPGWTDVTVEAGILHSGRKYYLSSTAGKISFTAPTSGYVKQVGFGVAPDLLDIRIGPSIKLTN